MPNRRLPPDTAGSRIITAFPRVKIGEKIIADAAFCRMIDVLLTTDRKHLANKGIKIRHLKIFTPKELFEYLSSK